MQNRSTCDHQEWQRKARQSRQSRKDLRPYRNDEKHPQGGSNVGQYYEQGAASDSKYFPADLKSVFIQIENCGNTSEVT
ncbi:hypothetical protein AJ87_47510 [Rhizobium yanglingense]|nr:hypothetical protein AJ87_47510 [Rhizobium yanglingense]